MELELFAPKLSLIPAPVDLPTIPCLVRCLLRAELVQTLSRVCSCSLGCPAEQQEGAGLLKEGSAIPLQELLLFCTGSLHPARKEDNNQNQGLCLFPKKSAASFGKTLVCLHLQGLGESDLFPFLQLSTALKWVPPSLSLA